MLIGTGTKACIDLSDIYLDKDVFKACIKLKITWENIPVNFDLGCFTIPIHKMYEEYMAEEAVAKVLVQRFGAQEKGKILRRLKGALGQA